LVGEDGDHVLDNEDCVQSNDQGLHAVEPNGRFMADVYDACQCSALDEHAIDLGDIYVQIEIPIGKEEAETK
jgi:hypothetical protein